MSGDKTKYPKFHISVTIRAYAKETWEGVRAMTAGAFQFTLGLVALVSLPLWYPVLIALFRLKYPAYLKEQARARGEVMNQLFPDKEDS